MRNIYFMDSLSEESIEKVNNHFIAATKQWLNYLSVEDLKAINGLTDVKNSEIVFLHIFRMFGIDETLTVQIITYLRMMNYGANLHELIKDGIQRVEKTTQYRLLIGDQLVAEMMCSCMKNEKTSCLLPMFIDHSIQIMEGLTEKYCVIRDNKVLTLKHLCKTDAKYYDLAFYAAGYLAGWRNEKLSALQLFGNAFGVQMKAITYGIYNETSMKEYSLNWNILPKNEERDILFRLLQNVIALVNENGNNEHTVVLR